MKRHCRKLRLGYSAPITLAPFVLMFLRLLSFPARALLTALLLAAGLALSPVPAVAQEAEAHYHLDMLSAAQRSELFRRIDSYALVEVFLNSCGRRPALERRLRRIVAGCIRQSSVNTIAAHYRRALAARAALRWDCRSSVNRPMIARSEHAIHATVTDIARLCRRS